MHKARGFLPKASKTWLYNAALFALICAAFAAGIIIGPMLASRGNKDERKIRCTPDAMAQKTPTTVDSKCVSSKEFQALLLEWSQSSQIIDEKMLNVSIRKIIPSMRKQLRANNEESKKALQGKLVSRSLLFPIGLFINYSIYIQCAFCKNLPNENHVHFMRLMPETF